MNDDLQGSGQPAPPAAKDKGDAFSRLESANVAEQNVRRIAELERANVDGASLANRLSSRIAAFCGSMTFVWLHMGWFGLWVAYNTLPWFGKSHPDPYPFNFLTLVVSLESIFLSAFIMISQRREGALAERRSHLDLQINLLAEQESTETLRLLRCVADKLGLDREVSAVADELEAETPVEAVSELIEKNIEGCEVKE